MTKRRLVSGRAATALVVVILTGVASAVCSACSAGSDASASPSDSPRGQPGTVVFSQTLRPFWESGDGGLGHRIDVTPSGHVVVACRVRGSSAATVSLTPSGIDWQFLRDRHDEDAAELDWSDQEVAADGSVVAVGIRYDYSTSGTSLVVSRFVDADTRFDTAYQETGHSLRGTAVAIGGDGAIYVVGVREDTADIVLIKYDQTLQQAWVRHYGGVAYEWGRAVAVVGDGVYVAGEGYRRGRSLDLLVMRYDAQTGKRIWARYVRTGDRRKQEFDGLVVRPSGVCVCGHVISARQLHPIPQAVLAKISPSGVQRWVCNSSATWWMDIGAAPDGSLRLTGRLYRRGGDLDMVTATYRRDGTRLWRCAYASAGGGYDCGSVLDVDASGTTYVGGATGSVTAGHETDLLMIAYDRTGKRLWVTTSPGGNVDGLYYGVMDLDTSNDSVWVTGTSVDYDVLVLQLQK